MSNIRTFIAIELSPDARSRATDLINRLKEAQAKVTWVKPQHLHLTLKFLGDVPESEIPDVCRVVSEAVRGIEPFEVVFRGCGAFPNTRGPRTVWIGVEQGAEVLAQIHESLDIALKKQLRFPRENKRFRPHLTLGRVRESGPNAAELGRLLDELPDFDGDLTVVDSVVTFASFLDPQGPTHQPLGHADLGK